LDIQSEIGKKYEARMARNSESLEVGKKILILDCSGPSKTAELMVLADERLDGSNCEVVNVVDGADELPSSFENIAAIMISGSPSNIEDKEKPGYEWISNVETFVNEALKLGVPTLGICFGIQMFADIKGREVPKNGNGREYGVWKTAMYIDENDEMSEIFNGIDFQKDEEGHSSAVIETVGGHSFHAGYGTEQRENLYAFRYSGDEAYPMIEIEDSFVGLQFHPELSTPEGLQLLRAIIRKRADLFLQEGKEPEKVIEELDDYMERADNEKTPDGLKIYRNFVNIALEK